MASNRTVGMSLLKWVAAPIALAALGFYVVGPRVANRFLEGLRQPAIPAAEAPDKDAPAPVSQGEPKVEVSAERARSSGRRRRTSSGVRQPTRDEAPEEAPEYNPEPEADPGSPTDDADGA